MPARCYQCGLVAPDDRLMHKYWPGPSGNPQLYCPACWNKREERTKKLETRFMGLMALCLLAGAMFIPDDQGGQLARLAVVFMVVHAASVGLHELGHAVAAWMMGMRVTKFSLGRGRTVWTRRFGDLEIEINALPLTGYVIAGGRSLLLSRTRQLVFTFGGPAANLALAAGASVIIDDDWASVRGNIAAVSILHVVAVVNAIIAFMNLIPFSFPADDNQIGPSVQPNDGMLLLMTALARGSQFRHWLVGSVRRLSIDRMRRGDANGAMTAVHEAVDRYPDLPLLRVVGAEVLGRLGRYDEARAEIEAILARDDLDPPTRGAAQVTLCELIVDAGDADSMPLADRTSDQLMRVATDVPAVRLVRGRVLVATGWVEKGAGLIEPLLGEVDSPQFAAECACALAFAQLAGGDREKARHYRDLARSLDDKCARLAALDRAIQS